MSVYMALKLNLDPPCDNPSLQAGSQEPLQGGGLANSTALKIMLLFLPLQGPELQDIQGHREKTIKSRPILERTHNKNGDKVRWERFISVHYSFCNGFFFFLRVFGLSDWRQLNYSLWKQAKRDSIHSTNWKSQLMTVLVRRKKITQIRRN